MITSGGSGAITVSANVDAAASTLDINSAAGLTASGNLHDAVYGSDSFDGGKASRKVVQEETSSTSTVPELSTSTGPSSRTQER